MTLDDMIAAVIRREGGYVDHPADRGGPTKYGITQATLSGWLGRAASANDVANMSEATARDIYKANYFIKPGFDAIPDPALQALMFDFGVNSGPAAATKALQTAPITEEKALVTSIEDAPVTLTFKASQVNYLMNVLATRPFGEVLEIINYIKAEGDKQVDAYRAALVPEADTAKTG